MRTRCCGCRTSIETTCADCSPAAARASLVQSQTPVERATPAPHPLRAAARRAAALERRSRAGVRRRGRQRGRRDDRAGRGRSWDRSASTAKSAIRWWRCSGPWTSDRTRSCAATSSPSADGCGGPRARRSTAASRKCRSATSAPASTCPGWTDGGRSTSAGSDRWLASSARPSVSCCSCSSRASRSSSRAARSKESAQRVADEPMKATLVGLAAWVLVVPMFTLTAIVLVDLDRRHSAADPPAVCGADPAADGASSDSAAPPAPSASGRGADSGSARRRGFVDICLGILIILLPLLVGRFVAFGGWPLSPIVFLLVATGLAVEFLAWSSGFGAVLTNAFSRWQATRSARTASRTAPTTP